MKYNAEVDSEKRNISPRNDLLRNRKCVGIIQAAKKSTHRHVYVIYNDDRPGPRCVQMPEPAVRGQAGGGGEEGGGGGFGEPSRLAGLRQR